MSANPSDPLIYARTMADARRIREEMVERALQPVCAKCGKEIDQMGLCDDCWDFANQED